MNYDNAVKWARKFHKTYEQLAPQFGYETRKDTREFNPDSPNGQLMVAVMLRVFEGVYMEGGENE